MFIKILNDWMYALGDRKLEYLTLNYSFSLISAPMHTQITKYARQ
jgi:hypothetical protein